MTADEAREVSFDRTDPASFRFWHTDVLRFGDLDTMGHVNHLAIGACFENTRIVYWPYIELATSGESFLTGLVRQTVEFRGQLYHPGTVRTGCRLARVGRSSHAVRQGMFDEAGACVAVSETVHVRIARATHRAQPWPPEVRARLLRALADAPTLPPVEC